MTLGNKKVWIAGALVGLGAVAALRRQSEGAFSYRPSLPVRLYSRAAVWVDQRIGWHNLPLPLAVATIIGERVILREQNLHDTDSLPSLPVPDPEPPAGDYLSVRTPDGSFNDLDYPAMGRAERRFGRNVPLGETYPDPLPAIMEPNPRAVSRELLTRDRFIAAESLNLHAAAWIQFMVRDWMSHGRGDIGNPWQVPLPAGDDWHQKPMLIPRTMADPTRPPDDGGAPPTFINVESPWWDASQLYPRDDKLRDSVRAHEHGKLKLTPDGQLPPELLEILAQQPGWWLGLGMMYTLFAREHNAICGRLRAEYPGWSDEELFNRARLINAALIAKIHTVEWTPAIIAHPATRYALRANWWGLQGERLHRALGRLSDSQIISGIPGSPTSHHSAPYSLTEEFNAVYRMHPLIRDDYSFRRTADNGIIEERTFDQVTDRRGNELLASIPTTDLFYSFGTLHPGAITLHNFPRHLQHFIRPDGKVMDLASVDIMRTRELGVPRYTRFRDLLHMRPVRSFEELTANQEWAKQLREVYDNRIERVDLMVGMFAETPPHGFGFSDTAFRIFILMASRRLKSDRFFTRDFTPKVYTPAGMEWIADNTMGTVLLRHFPTLAPALREVENAFHPWPLARS